jgi:hypothetical protein
VSDSILAYVQLLLINLHRALQIVQEESQSRTLLLISGFIHDVSMFLDSHPGGPVLLTQNSGKDMTASFFGGVYAHSHAAHNVRAMALFAYPMMLMTDSDPPLPAVNILLHVTSCSSLG